MNISNNKFFSYILILLSIIIIFIFIKDIIFNIQSNLDINEKYSLDLKNKKQELNKLSQLKNNIKGNNKDIDKYLLDIKEDEVIEYIYSYIESINNENGSVIIKDISISEPKNTDIWFRQTDINLNLVVSNEKKLNNILFFLTKEDSKYNFFIKNFSYPYWKINWSFSVVIPLKVLYK